MDRRTLCAWWAGAWWVGLTAKCPRCQFEITFRSLIPLIKHRCHPSDLSRPPPDTSYLWEHPRSEPSVRDSWGDSESELDIPDAGAGRLREPECEQTSHERAMMNLDVSLCEQLAHERAMADLDAPLCEQLAHERSMADLHAFLCSRPTPDDYLEVEGRGSLLTCGDIETNPGPSRPSGHLSLGRGMLSSCGDVEPNPGPETRRNQASSSRDVVMADALPTTPRRQNMRSCPFPSCPEFHRQLTVDTLVRHLGRVHVAAGQGIPNPVLQALGHFVCTACRHMVKTGSTCAFCSAAERPPLASEDVPEGVASPPPPSSCCPPNGGNSTGQLAA